MHVLVNLKAYDCSPSTIADAAESVDGTGGATIGIAPQAAQIAEVANTAIETWAQHVDGIKYGSHTGSTHPEAVTAAGAEGTLLNHSEHRLTLDEIDTGIQQAQAAGLSVIVCANTPAQVGAVAALGPDGVAIEPPELIGTGTPVSKADPDIVRDAVDAVAAVDADIPVYCGAGISTGEDVAAAKDLGADGVLLASGVAKADDPAVALTDLVAEL